MGEVQRREFIPGEGVLQGAIGKFATRSGRMSNGNVKLGRRLDFRKIRGLDTIPPTSGFPFAEQTEFPGHKPREFLRDMYESVRINPALPGAIVRNDRQSIAVRKCSGIPVRFRLVLMGLLIGTALSGCARMRNLLVGPTNESQKLVEQARNAVNAHEYGHARDLLKRADELSPNDAEVHRLQARVFVEQNRNSEAIEHLRTVIELDTGDFASRVQLAHLLVDAGLEDEAAQPLRDALKLNPTHVDGLLLKAELAERSGKRELAMETLHRVLSCDAEQVDAKLRLARLQFESGHADRAAPLLRSLKDCPQSTPAQRAEAQWLLGLIYGSEQRWDDASREMTSACNVKRNLTDEDWYRMAYARIQVQDYDGAKQAAAKCLAINSQHEGALVLSTSFEAYVSKDANTLNRPIVPIGYVANSIPVPNGWQRGVEASGANVIPSQPGS